MRAATRGFRLSRHAKQRSSLPWLRRFAGTAVTLLRCTGYFQRRIRRQRGLRILTYHGVCGDDVAGEPWVPPHFVAAPDFARQMCMLTELGRVVHLPEVLDDLLKGRPFNGATFAITFDDGHACTLRHALPTMSALGIRGTFFVVTGHVDSGEGLLSDRLRLLSSLPASARPDMPPELRFYVESPGRMKRAPRDQVGERVEAYWPTAVERLDPRRRETLRPASWSALTTLVRGGHELGAHTVSHVILSRETRERRLTEIANSIRRVREQTGTCMGFAYPNGGPADFDAQDVEVLRREGVLYALTTTPGSCVSPVDPYRLPRTSIGLGHDLALFTLEMTGCLDRRRRRQHLGAWAR